MINNLRGGFAPGFLFGSLGKLMLIRGIHEELLRDLELLVEIGKLRFTAHMLAIDGYIWITAF